jgi:hypothetical protein
MCWNIATKQSGRIWHQPHGECEKLRKALLDYCGQDTLALDTILGVIRGSRT